MSSRKLLTVFGSTGNQGGSVIDVVLALPDLKEKYSLRGITRDTSSGKSKALAEKGVEMVAANVDDAEALKAAVRGSYGVFGVTDFWSIMDKARETQQGKNIFEACKAENIKHFVFSSLPSADKMSGGKYKMVEHFDSKADVDEYVDSNKGDMITSSFQPAMFASVSANAQVQDGVPTLALPFPSEDMAWPVLDPRRDTGKFVMGLIEGGSLANGIKVHGATTWTTPKEVVSVLSEVSGQKVAFKSLDGSTYEKIMTGAMGPQVGKEISDMMRYIGEYNYFGPGEEKNQKEHHDKWLVKGAEAPYSYPEWAKANAPFKFKESATIKTSQ